MVDLVQRLSPMSANLPQVFEDPSLRVNPKYASFLQAPISSAGGLSSDFHEVFPTGKGSNTAVHWNYAAMFEAQSKAPARPQVDVLLDAVLELKRSIDELKLAIVEGRKRETSHHPGGLYDDLGQQGTTNVDVLTRVGDFFASNSGDYDASDIADVLGLSTGDVLEAMDTLSTTGAIREADV